MEREDPEERADKSSGRCDIEKSFVSTEIGVDEACVVCVVGVCVCELLTLRRSAGERSDMEMLECCKTAADVKAEEDELSVVQGRVSILS